jgi:uncharacterized protein with HEPN domain
MQHSRVVVLLEDLLIASKAILSHTDGITTFQSFVNNRLVFSAVERELTIIAEAINKIKKEDSKIEFMHSQQIVGLRNRLIHDYANTNKEIIWGVVVLHIKPLIDEVKLLIEKHENF